MSDEKDKSASWNFSLEEQTKAQLIKEEEQKKIEKRSGRNKPEPELKLELESSSKRKSRTAAAEELDHDEVADERKRRVHKREKSSSFLATARRFLILFGYLLFIAVVIYLLQALEIINLHFLK